MGGLLVLCAGVGGQVLKVLGDDDFPATKRGMGEEGSCAGSTLAGELNKGLLESIIAARRRS